VDITRHPFRGLQDMPLVLDLIRAAPPACRHVIDSPWRLTSPSIAAGRDSVYWQDADGRAVALAAWQQAWAALDFYIRPGLPAATATDIEQELFGWAGQRFRQQDAERGHPVPYAVEFRDDDEDRRRLATAHGFTRHGEGYVYFEHELGELPPRPALPDGFTTRPLAGAVEAAAYAAADRAAFANDAMTARWRERTLCAPLYDPGLDLVVTAPDGTIAGFCVGWHHPARGVAQIEPLGVRPDFRRRGLARALLVEMLHGFRTRGASVAAVETETNLGREPARAAYAAVGFTQAHLISRWEAWAAEIA